MNKQRRVQLALITACFLMGGFGAAFAQGTPPAPVGDSPATTGQIQERAALTAEQQVEQANVVRRRAVSIRDRLMSMLDAARRERDIIRVTCLDDKLAQVNANIETLDRRVDALTAAAERQDENSRNHEYTVIVVLDQKFQVLEQEANQCIGQDLFETGATRVVTDVEEDTTLVDPSLVEVQETDSSNYIPSPASASR
jgi:hypothetical protein